MLVGGIDQAFDAEVDHILHLAHELDEQVIRIMKMGQKSLLANPSQMAINSAHGLAFHRGLGTPLQPTSSTTFTKYLDPEEIYNFARSAYSKPNIAVVANGTSQSELSKWVLEFFEDTFTGGKKLESPPTKYHGGEERIAHDKGNVMVLAFPGSSSFTSGASYKPELAVLAALLGGQSSIKWTPGFSLLAKAAAEHHNAHISTQNFGYSDAGLLAVTVTGNALHVAKASQSVVETLKKIASGNVSGEDIKKATALAKFQALETGQDINAGLEATGSGLIAGGKAYQIDEIGQAIEKVGEDKVKAVIISWRNSWLGADFYRLRNRYWIQKPRCLPLVISSGYPMRKTSVSRYDEEDFDCAVEYVHTSFESEFIKLRSWFETPLERLFPTFYAFAPHGNFVMPQNVPHEVRENEARRATYYAPTSHQP
jgi:Peptidase M16 inactive domain